MRDLHNVAGALGAQPGMKQQTFLLEGGMTAGFSAGAGATAGKYWVREELAPTLKGGASGNSMPSVLCLNDQGGANMACSIDVTGTLRARNTDISPSSMNTTVWTAAAPAPILSHLLYLPNMAPEATILRWWNRGLYTVSPATSPTTMQFSVDSGWICSRTAR